MIDYIRQQVAIADEALRLANISDQYARLYTIDQQQLLRARVAITQLQIRLGVYPNGA